MTKKTPKEHVLDAFATGNAKTITSYLNKYYGTIVNYYKKDAKFGKKMEGKGQKTRHTLRGNRQIDRQNEVDRVEKEAEEIFGI